MWSNSFTKLFLFIIILHIWCLSKTTSQWHTKILHKLQMPNALNLAITIHHGMCNSTTNLLIIEHTWLQETLFTELNSMFRLLSNDISNRNSWLLWIFSVSWWQTLEVRTSQNDDENGEPARNTGNHISWWLTIFMMILWLIPFSVLLHRSFKLIELR